MEAPDYSKQVVSSKPIGSVFADPNKAPDYVGRHISDCRTFVSEHSTVAEIGRLPQKKQGDPTSPSMEEEGEARRGRVSKVRWTADIGLNLA